MDWAQGVETGFTAAETVEEYVLGTSPTALQLQMAIWTLGAR